MVALTLAGLITVGWFATEDVRAERALKFDKEVEAALDRDDYPAAARAAQFADALSHSPERRIGAASTAYLASDFAVAADRFASVVDTYPRQAGLGAAAAVVRLGERERYGALKQHADDLPGWRLVALEAGDYSQAARELAGHAGTTAAYPAAIAIAIDDPARALTMVPPNLESLGSENLPSVGEASTIPALAYEKMLRRYTEVTPETVAELRLLLARLTQVSSTASRRVGLAEHLAKHGRPHAAEPLAQAAVRDAPIYRDAWNVLAIIQLKLYRLTDAERSLDTSLKLDDAYGYTWYLRGTLAELRGDPDRATEYRERAELLGYRAG